MKNSSSSQRSIYYHIGKIESNNEYNMFCWGNHELKIISALLQTKVKCLVGLKDICEMIGSYCAGSKDYSINIDLLFQEYLQQVENSQNEKEESE